MTNDVYDKKEAFDENDQRYESDAMAKVRERVAKYPWLRDETRFIRHVRIFEERRIIFHRKMPREQGPPGQPPTEPPIGPPRDLSREIQQLEGERCPRCGGKMTFAVYWDGRDADGKPAGGLRYHCLQCKNVTYHRGGAPRPDYKRVHRPETEAVESFPPAESQAPQKREIDFVLPEQERGASYANVPPLLSPITQPLRDWGAFCDNCGKRVRAGDYCNQCGEPLAKGSPRRVDDTCSRCGGVVDRWTLRCGDCGAQYETWICDACGSPISAEDRLCPRCRTKLIWR